MKRPTPWAWTVMSLAAVLAGAGVSWVWSERRSCASEPAAMLLEWAESASPHQPRWSGCFNPAEAHIRRTSLTPLQAGGAMASFAVRSRVRSARTTHELGVATVLYGDADRGLAILEAAADTQRDSNLLSDVAAAYLLRFSRNNLTADVVRALDLAVQALNIDPASLNALFNLGLALTALNLDEDARDVWRTYAGSDRGSPWRERAARHLADVEAQSRVAERRARALDSASPPDSSRAACADAPEFCRVFIEETLLPRWAASYGQSDPTAAAALDRARMLAGVLRSGGEPLDAEAIDDLDRAARSDGKRLAQIAAGYSAYGDGRRRFELDEESVPLLTRAERHFESARHPLEGWAHANRVYAEFNRYSGAELTALGSILARRAADAESHRYRALQGRLAYLVGLSFANRADYEPALRWYETSAAALEAGKQPDHLAATLIGLATVRMRLGEPEEAWNLSGRALALTADTASPRRRYATLLVPAAWGTDRGMPYASIRMLSCAIDVAKQSGQPLRIAEASLSRARAYHRVGLKREARADLEAARPDPPRTGRWGVEERSRYEYLAAVADLNVNTDSVRSVEAATAALSFFENRSFSARVALLRLTRGRAYRGAGQRDLAEADFATGIETYERYRRGLNAPQQRMLSQTVMWDLYEELIQATAERDTSTALMTLEASERARARTLLDVVRHTTESPAIEPQTLASDLNPSVRVLYYTLLERELLMWVIGPDRIEARRATVERSGLERRVESFTRALVANQAWQALAEELYAIVFEPVAPLVPPDASIVIVPDGALHRLAFGALRQPHTGTFLAERFALTVVPSASVLRELAARVQVSTISRRALVFADPLASSVSEGAGRLAGAQDEASAIARLYSDVEVISRERATKRAFAERAPTADVVHFAGHGVASPEFPLLARLQFASEVGDMRPSMMSAEEISALRFPSTSVVVLAACRTGTGAVQRGEGVMSLARPFLIAGVPSVVATLWDIDDRWSSDLLVLLHQHLAAGIDPAAALQRAQRQVMTSAPPAVWAPFVVVGSPGSRTLHEETKQ